MEQIDEPVLLAPVPDGQGHVMIDGSHRAAIRVRAGIAIEGLLLTAIESARWRSGRFRWRCSASPRNSAARTCYAMTSQGEADIGGAADSSTTDIGQAACGRAPACSRRHRCLRRPNPLLAQPAFAAVSRAQQSTSAWPHWSDRTSSDIWKKRERGWPRTSTSKWARSSACRPTQSASRLLPVCTSTPLSHRST